MFIYSTTSELQGTINEHHDDVIVLIDRQAKGERGLIDTMALALKSPYKDDNWDGITEVLIDPFWLDGKIVRIIHYELPDLSNDEMKTYVSILKYIDEAWKNKSSRSAGRHCSDLIIYFNSEYKEYVESLI